jgi:integrase
MPINPNQIKTLPLGDHADQGGLYLSVRGKPGDLNRVWQFRFTDLEGKRAGMDIGRFGDRDVPGKSMTQSTARETCLQYKIALKAGTDPRIKKKLDAGNSITFKEYAERTYPGWCVGKHPDEAKQWKRSIADLATLHDLKLPQIDNPEVIEALKPIWYVKPITANRTRERLEKLLDAAKVEKLRSGENPARWKGNLKLILPSARKLNAKTKKGHASVPYAKVPSVFHSLRYEVGNIGRLVEVGILTCTRSQEIRWMEWDELDLDAKTWLIPGSKMKIKGESADGRPHLIPLSDQAIAIIKSMPKRGKFVFPSDAKQNEGKHEAFLANALTNCLKRASGVPITMHGNRTTFRNWGADNKEHNFRREVLEFCLSHRIGDEAELSYWTSEMLDRRREVMDAWAIHVTSLKTTKPKVSKPALRLVS